MKKILFITAMLIGFLGSAQDSIVKAVSLKGRGPFLVKGSMTGTTITGAQIVDSLNLELGSTDWQDGDQTAAEVPNTPSGNIAATNVQAAINELDTEKVATTIAGRTGDAVEAVMIQDEADYISDGDPGTNEVVFCRGCPPMQVGTSATIDIDKYRGYDDRATDAATFTFSNLKTGAAVLIEINRASDATYSGVTIAHTTGAFAANTRQLVTIFVLPSGDVLRDYKDLE